MTGIGVAETTGFIKEGQHGLQNRPLLFGWQDVREQRFSQDGPNRRAAVRIAKIAGLKEILRRHILVGGEAIASLIIANSNIVTANVLLLYDIAVRPRTIARFQIVLPAVASFCSTWMPVEYMMPTFRQAVPTPAVQVSMKLL